MCDSDTAREAADWKALCTDYGFEIIRVDHCIICGKQGDKLDDGGVWATDIHTVHDPEGDYLDGDELDSAKDTPWGWVCSDTCYSQAVYNACDCKAELNALVDACRVLKEHGEKVARFINKKTDYFLDDTLCYTDFLDEINDADSPAWLNRPTREEALETAAEKAAAKAEEMAMIFSLYARCTNDKVWADIYAQRAAQAGNIALDLREAIKEAE